MQTSGHIGQHIKSEKRSLDTNTPRMLSKLSTMELKLTACSNKTVVLKVTIPVMSSYVTSTLRMISKHGSLLVLRLQLLSQYLLSNFNNYHLNADIWSYRSAYKIGKEIAGHKNTKNAFKAIDYGTQAYGMFKQNRGFEGDDASDVFVRDLEASDDLEAREPLGVKAFTLVSVIEL